MKSVHSRAKRVVERAARVRILRTRTLPRGVDVVADIRRDLPWVQPVLVFDVGANVGESTASYLAAFPAAEVYCFEPVASTFATLESRFASEGRVHCRRLAFGESKASRTISVGADSSLASLSPSSAVPEGAGRSEVVAVNTIDEFAAAEGLDRIGFLKIDTEGHDLSVLEGAKGMLDRQAIDLIEVEAGMNADNQTHVPFELLREHLAEREYLLFGLYDQIPEWTLGKPHLRRTNPVFVSSKAIENYTKP